MIHADTNYALKDGISLLFEMLSVYFSLSP